MLQQPKLANSDELPRVLLTWYGAGTNGGATLGDLYAVENLSLHLTARGVRHTVLSAFPLSTRAPVIRDPARIPDIDVVVHVCGPLLPSPFLVQLLERAKVRVAVGVSVLDHLEAFNEKFDAIVVRDGQEPETFDLAPARFAAAPVVPGGPEGKVPLVGLCLRGFQREYNKATIHHDKAAAFFAAAIDKAGGVARQFDTVLRNDNTHGDIEAAFRQSEIVATTRMHGAILGLCFGKPVVAIDQVEGGAKVANLLGRVGWPLVFRGDTVTQAQVDEAFERARSPEIREVVLRCRTEIARLSAAAVETSVRTIAAMSKMSVVSG
jgi:hypothetical protein